MTRSQTFELLTPCFCAGISKSHPEMRLSSIRGQLRWWHRVLHGAGNPEYELFGGIKGKRFGYDDEAVASSFKFSLADNTNLHPMKSMLVPHKRGRNSQPDTRFEFPSLPPTSRYTLTWSAQPHPDFAAKADDMLGAESRSQQLERLLKTWLLLGTLGRRATRAMGSVWPVDFAPTVEEFESLISSLQIPSTVKIAVLNANDPNPRHTTDELTKIAGETVHGLKRHKTDRTTRQTTQGIDGDPLGYVDGPNRKASPLRFKVGKFSDGLRLIAIWDNRNNRGGNLSDAKDQICRPLSDWLDAAGF